MSKLVITVNGVDYPCYQTMGALLRFKDETGRDVTEMDGSVSDMCCFLWCCTVSACKREGKDFGLSLMDFADNLDPEVLTEWADNAMNGGNAEAVPADDEKKSL